MKLYTSRTVNKACLKVDIDSSAWGLVSSGLTTILSTISGSAGVKNSSFDFFSKIKKIKIKTYFY